MSMGSVGLVFFSGVVKKAQCFFSSHMMSVMTGVRIIAGGVTAVQIECPIIGTLMSMGIVKAIHIMCRIHLPLWVRHITRITMNQIFLVPVDGTKYLKHTVKKHILSVFDNELYHQSSTERAFIL